MVKAKDSDNKEASKTKVVRAKPVAKSIENNVSSSHTKSKGEGEGVRLTKKIQTAEGWKREQKKLRAKK